MLSLATAARLPRKTTSLPPTTGEQTRWWPYKTDSQSTTIACRCYTFADCGACKAITETQKKRLVSKQAWGRSMEAACLWERSGCNRSPCPRLEKKSYSVLASRKGDSPCVHTSPFLSAVNGHCVGWIPSHDGNDRSGYVKKAETP